MATIKRSSMKDQVYALLKERIFNQYYKSGEEIKILTLSNELGISNTPIREALNMLVAEGLLTVSLNNKFRVIELNEREMSELNEAMSLILIGSYHAAHRDGRDVDLASMLREKYEAQLAAKEEGDQEKYISASIDFDRCFVAVTGNEKLIGIYDSNNYLLHLYVRHTYWKEMENIEKKLREHEDLIYAVEQGDGALVEDLLMKHYDEHYIIRSEE